MNDYNCWIRLCVTTRNTRGFKGVFIVYLFCRALEAAIDVCWASLIKAVFEDYTDHHHDLMPLISMTF